MSSEWPMYGRNPQNTAYTTASGPTKGEIDWTFPIGLPWYASPLIEDGRVYSASPGIRTLAYCFDAETGDTIWKTRRIENEPIPKPSDPPEIIRGPPSSYASQSVASTPILTGDTLIFQELGAQGNNQGERFIRYIDKRDGSVTKAISSGQMDYRAGHPAIVGDEEAIIYPTGTHKLNASERYDPPHISEINRIVCKEPDTGATRWNQFVGPVFAEPAYRGERAFVGTFDGIFYGLNVPGTEDERTHFYTNTERIAWQFTGRASFNSPAVIHDESVYVGDASGTLYRFRARDGEIVWSHPIEAPEPNAFKQFSRPTIVDGTLFVGSASETLYAINTDDGALVWKQSTDDWIRAAPVYSKDSLIIADLAGNVYSISPQTGTINWKRNVSRYPIFADPKAYQGDVFVSDSDLVLRCLSLEDGEVRWVQKLIETVEVDGQEYVADELASGGRYQSKPTVADGTVFIGTPSKFVIAIDTESGEEQWRHEVGGAISGAPAYHDEQLFFGQQGGEDRFYCVDARDGRPVWDQSLGWIWSSATIIDDRVYAPSCDRDFYCVDVEDGAIRWRYRSGGGAHPEPPVDDGRVYFGSWDYNTYAFDAETGSHLWRFNAGGSPDSGAPLANDGKLYLPVAGDTYRCVDGETGDIIWEYSTSQGSFNASSALAHGNVYISHEVRPGATPLASKIMCLDAGTGDLVWEHEDGGGITGPAVAGDRVYFGSSSSSYFYCVDAHGNEDGTTEELWRVRMNDRIDESVPAITDDQAFILSADGNLYAFR